MVSDRKTFDVFLSHAISDAKFAAEVAANCRSAGLSVFATDDLPPGASVTDAIWEALAESLALLAILGPAGPTPPMAIEIGAARAWSKPIFAITPDPSSARLPAAMAGVPLYTLGRIDDVIQSVKSSGRELTEGDRASLTQLYRESGVSVDRLALEPVSLSRLAGSFQATTGKAISGEQLLSEMLRMRKQGRLKRARYGTQGARSRESAS